jgi:hypothetical protein
MDNACCGGGDFMSGVEALKASVEENKPGRKIVVLT